MKQYLVFKKIINLLLIMTLIVGLAPSNGFTSYAAIDEISNFDLSGDGKVVANYDASEPTDKKIVITGEGTIKFDNWVAMAQKINPAYYGNGGPSTRAWHYKKKEDFNIVFTSANDNDIKLCGSAGYMQGLFTGFSGEIRFDKLVNLAPDVTNLSFIFAYAPKFNQPLNHWHVDNIANMRYMFKAVKTFNQPLNNWHTTNVTNMSNMFNDADAFNQPLNSWNVGNVTDMSYMFKSADSFNQPLNNWQTKSATNMRSMFYDAVAFNQPLSNWHTANVTTMRSLFTGATTFNQSLNSWNVSNVTDMSYMFKGTNAFNQPLNNWKTASVTDMRSMFNRATAFNQSLDSWNVSNVTDMSYMFKGATTFNQSLTSWKTNSATNMRSMFYDAVAFNQPLNNWNTASVTDMRSMFTGAIAFNQSVNSWNVSNVTDMSYMFKDADNFNQPLNNWQTDSVTDMRSMFYDAVAFNQPLNNWNTTSVTDMSHMFKGAVTFNQPLNNWHTANVTTMRSLFKGASNFNQPLDNWKTANVTDMDYMLADAAHYKQPIELDISSLTDSLTDLFDGCPTASITLNNPANNKDINVKDVIKGLTLSYLEFSGLKNAKITGFSGNYIVEDVVAKTTTTCALNMPFTFTDNRHYKVYLAPKDSLELEDISKNYQTGQTANQSIDLAALMPDDAGVITTSMGAISGTNPTIFASGANAPKLTDNILNYKLSGSGAIDDTAILPLTVSSVNYQDASFNLIIKLLGIPKKSLSDCNVAPIPNQPYTGSEIKPPLTITDGSYQLVKDTDYTAVYADNSATGTAKVTITGKGSYNGTVVEYYSIVATTVHQKDDFTDDDNDGWQSASQQKVVVIKNPSSDAIKQKQPTTPVNSTKKSQADQRFTDVKQDDWFDVAVDNVVKKGLMYGTSSNSFSPKLNTTRAMLVTLLYRLAAEPAVSHSSDFSDVADNMWYSKTIAWSQANGVAKGYQDGSFKPNDNLTREQLVAMLYRYANAKQYDVSAKANLTSYSDSASITPYALDAMQWAVKSGVIRGTTATTLDPQGRATRAQLAMIITRFNELFTK